MDDAEKAKDRAAEKLKGSLCQTSNHAVNKETTVPWETAQQHKNQDSIGLGELSGSSSEKIEVDLKEEQEESAANGEVGMAVKDELDELLGLQVQFGESPVSPMVSSESPIRQEKKSDGFRRRKKPRQHLHQVQPVDIGGDAFKMWSDVGLSLGLSSDPEIATFLLQHYESTKNILFPSNQCRVCHQPLSLFCLKCNRSASCQPLLTLPRSRKAVEKTSHHPQQPPRRTKKHPAVVNIASKRRRKKKSRQSKRKKEEATIPSNSTIELGSTHDVDDDAAMDNGGDEEGLDKKEEDWGSACYASSDDQPAQVQKSPYDVTEAKNKVCSLKCPKGIPVGGEEKSFNCKVCDHNYTRACSLKAHMRKHTGEKPFKCTQCDAAFSLSGSLIVHRRTHTGDKPYVCEHCGRSFAISNALKQHRRQHTGEKPYQCGICFSKYSRSDSLKVHMRIHSGDRPFICEECGADFSRLYCLIAHKKKHSGERPFQCTECEATFTQSGKLTIHMRKHTGDRPFQCEQCGASFTQSDRLKTHMRIHSGEKPYKCGECGKGFSHPHSLKVHGRAHTGDRPYKCDICSLTFADPSYFRRHKAKHTSSSASSDATNAACVSVPEPLVGGFPVPVSATADSSVPMASSSSGASVPLPPSVGVSVPDCSPVISAGYQAVNSSILTSVSPDCFSVTSAGFSVPNSSSVPSMGFSVPSSSGLGFPMPVSSSMSVVADETDAMSVVSGVSATDPYSFLRSALQCTGSYPT